MEHSPVVSVRNIVLGEGIPKICIPLVSTSFPALLNDMKRALEYGADLIEWRTDWMEDIFKEGYLEEILPTIRKAAGNTPLLFTFRTKKEGGNMAASLLQYKDLVKKVICSSLVKTIFSNHDFFKTPSENKILSILKQMEEAGADIAKIAVMPTCTEDVLTLLSATCKAKKELSCPVITMSMAKAGLISRLSGEVFGSCLTFGAAGNVSAPGQINALKLRSVLEILHENS